MQAKWLKSKHNSGTALFEFQFKDVICCTPGTLERLSSQLESLIVRTEFCHAHIERQFFGTICGSKAGR